MLPQHFRISPLFRAIVSKRLRAIGEGQHSIRVNQQWRICFRWADADAFEVEIVDYH
jgi:plasmid maintenance system killer protein